MNFKTYIVVLFVFLTSGVFAQDYYYKNANGKKGEDLKNALNDIISGHREFTYTQLWTLLAITDQDPNNAENVILIYTGRSQDKDFRDRGNDYDYSAAGYVYQDSWNREHIWSKSHGSFGTVPAAGTDLHHIRPADHSVNNDRYTRDFDNGGTPHDEATECKYDSDSWEPRDDVKGDIARMMFYMAIRYEGENNEPDLELVDRISSYPNPEFGVLSTLLEWNRQDPPDDFETRRNHWIYRYQGNRNPFIDNPAYAEMIWTGGEAPKVEFETIEINPEIPTVEQDITVSTKILSNSSLQSVALVYGVDYYNINTEVAMTASNNAYSATIPAMAAGTNVYYKIVVDANDTTYVSALQSYRTNVKFEGELVAISQIQGNTASSPYKDKVVSTKGIVTGVFGMDFYIQDKAGAWNGIYVYGSTEIPSVGDEVLLTAKVSEYYTLTELSAINFYQVVSNNNALPEPVDIPTSVLAAGSTEAEQYEGVLVRVKRAVCVGGLGSYGLWQVNDGSGICNIHNPTALNYKPTISDTYSITGIATFTYSENKIDIRSADDVEKATDTKAPELIDIVLVDAYNLTLYFNEDVDKQTVENILNYQISNGVNVTTAQQHGLQKNRVNLTIENLTKGILSLTINGVADLAGNTTSNLKISFQSQLTLVDEEVDRFLSVYPNPANDFISVSISNDYNTDYEINIYDLNGRKIQTSGATKKTNERLKNSYDLTQLKSGVYLMKIIANNKCNVFKFVKK